MFSWKNLRKLFNDIHLWLGLSAGLILFVVCLTGTIYTFRTEIEEWLNPDKYFVEAPAGASARSAEELIQQTARQVKEGKVVSLMIPANPERTYTVSIRKEGEKRGTNYMVDPYSGELKGDAQGRGSEFFQAIFRLHRWLLLDTEVGRPIVGVATLIFVFIILTGMIIWIPQRAKSWRQGLKIKWNGGWKRLNHDLHSALGIYTALFLLLMALTGLQWSFEWYRTGLRSLLGVEEPAKPAAQEKAVETAISSPGQALSIAALLEIADRELPYRGKYRLSFPEKEEEELISINKYRVGFFAPAAGDELQLNRFTGAVVEKQIFRQLPFNERVVKSIKALHIGDVYGVFSKIIYFISCLIATSLPVTGTIIWWNKRRKK